MTLVKRYPGKVGRDIHNLTWTADKSVNSSARRRCNDWYFRQPPLPEALRHRAMTCPPSVGELLRPPYAEVVWSRALPDRDKDVDCYEWMFHDEQGWLLNSSLLSDLYIFLDFRLFKFYITHGEI